jgi:hypothetical protein
MRENPTVEFMERYGALLRLTDEQLKLKFDYIEKTYGTQDKVRFDSIADALIKYQ